MREASRRLLEGLALGAPSSMLARLLARAQVRIKLSPPHFADDA